VLTGFMGTGKSTVGRALAAKLGYEFVDTDAIIVERHGTIKQIFERGGEGAFRQLERDTAVELAGRKGCVIATGGRFMLDEHNARVLVPTSDVFALVATPEEIARRVLKDGIANRPMLSDAQDPLQRIKDLVKERRAGYAIFNTVSTDGRVVDDIVAEITSRRRPRCPPSPSSYFTTRRPLRSGTQSSALRLLHCSPRRSSRLCVAAVHRCGQGAVRHSAQVPPSSCAAYRSA